MKGYTKDHKFIPMTDYKKVTRKSRDQKIKTHGVVIRKQRENNAEILRSELRSFNRQFPVHVEYGDDGSNRRGLVFEGTHSFIAGAMTRSEAIDCLIFCRRFIDSLPNERRKRDEALQPFVKNRVAENLAELDITLKDLREESRMKKLRGQPTGQVDSEIRLLGASRNSILTLLEQVPESLHKEITLKAEKERQEFL